MAKVVSANLSFEAFFGPSDGPIVRDGCVVDKNLVGDNKQRHMGAENIVNWKTYMDWKVESIDLLSSCTDGFARHQVQCENFDIAGRRRDSSVGDSLFCSKCKIRRGQSKELLRARAILQRTSRWTDWQ